MALVRLSAIKKTPESLAILGQKSFEKVLTLAKT